MGKKVFYKRTGKKLQRNKFSEGLTFGSHDSFMPFCMAFVFEKDVFLLGEVTFGHKLCHNFRKEMAKKVLAILHNGLYIIEILSIRWMDG